MLGSLSSSVIVNIPTASFKVTSDGLLRVTVTVSFTSSFVSARTATGIFRVVTPAANVMVPVPAV